MAVLQIENTNITKQSHSDGKKLPPSLAMIFSSDELRRKVYMGLQMKPLDKRIFVFSAKLTTLVSIAFLFIIYAPEHDHLVLLLISFALTFTGVGQLLKYKEQRNWSEKQAEVKKISEVEEEVAITEYSKLKYYYPDIEYQYILNGNSHNGNTASLEKESIWVPEINNWGDPTPKKERWWLSVKPGDEIPVYINPNNESESVLMSALINDAAKKRRSHHLALLVSGVLMGIVWLFLAYYT